MPSWSFMFTHFFVFCCLLLCLHSRFWYLSDWYFVTNLNNRISTWAFISIALLQTFDSSKGFTTLHFTSHPPIHTHIHPLMTEAAMQGSTCSPGAIWDSVSCWRKLWRAARGAGESTQRPSDEDEDDLLFILSHSRFWQIYNTSQFEGMRMIHVVAKTFFYVRLNGIFLYFSHYSLRVCVHYMFLCMFLYSIHNAVISVFQKKDLGENELYTLNEGVRSAISLFVFCQSICLTLLLTFTHLQTLCLRWFVF